MSVVMTPTSAALQRVEPPDYGVNSRIGMVVSASGEASDIGAGALARGGLEPQDAAHTVIRR